MAEQIGALMWEWYGILPRELAFVLEVQATTDPRPSAKPASSHANNKGGKKGAKGKGYDKGGKKGAKGKGGNKGKGKGEDINQHRAANDHSSEVME